MNLLAPPLADSEAGTGEFDRTLPGDFVLAGNAVLGCPPGPAAQPCRDSAEGRRTGQAGLNNHHSMVWLDSDADPGTFNSSSARVALPPGASVAYAKLTWAGEIRARSTGPCARSARWPQGDPRGQAVSLSLDNEKKSDIAPGEFTLTEDQRSPIGGDRWYSAEADVTDELSGLRGDRTVTVGNIWTGQGYDCFGGWSLLVVWESSDMGDTGDTPEKRVVVYDRHQRVDRKAERALLAPPGLRVAGGQTRIGITAYEGDRGLVGDTFAVNGRRQAEPKVPYSRYDFFLSNAEGASLPNNMSVDAKVVEAGPDIVRPGDSEVALAFTGTQDSYLIHSLALSFPQPAVSARTSVDRPVAHAGEPATQTTEVRNTGGVPLDGLAVDMDLGEECRKEIGELAPGDSAEVSCEGTVRDSSHQLAARVRGEAPGGQEVTAESVTDVRVLHPGLETRLTEAPAIAVAGQELGYQVELRNSGDSPLTGVSLAAEGPVTCAEAPAELSVGQAETVRCTVKAGEAGSELNFAGRARDELGAEVGSEARARFEVVRPGLALEVTGPDAPAPPGSQATVTVRLRNTSSVPLADLKVTGSPASCAREFPRLEPGDSLVYSCRVLAEEGATVSLSASAVPALGGAPLDTGFAVSAQSALRLAVQPPPQLPPQLPPPPDPPAAQPPSAPDPVSPPRAVAPVIPLPQPVAPPEPPEEPEKDAEGPLESPAQTAGFIAVLGVVVMMVSVGALSSATRGSK
ncbi:hypothetical protein [Amycolatopsis nigrescens]|uniref:hypothetical protein n=1 Tax=Amycolatopsis nigrescens TaxID=381445 RepID=UPI0012FB1E19|nr:hypothetical protein [Amycolatopsis nigrescens]